MILHFAGGRGAPAKERNDVVVCDSNVRSKTQALLAPCVKSADSREYSPRLWTIRLASQIPPRGITKASRSGFARERLPGPRDGGVGRRGDVPPHNVLCVRFRMSSHDPGRLVRPASQFQSLEAGVRSSGHDPGRLVRPVSQFQQCFRASRPKARAGTNFVTSAGPCSTAPVDP